MFTFKKTITLEWEQAQLRVRSQGFRGVGSRLQRHPAAAVSAYLSLGSDPRLLTQSGCKPQNCLNATDHP